MSDRVVVRPPGPPPLLHASPGVRCGSYMFVSGQMSTDWVKARPTSTRLPHGGDTTRVEVRQVFRNLQAVMEAGGLSLDDVARVDNYYGHRSVSTGHFAARDEFYAIDAMEKPASTAVQTDAFPADGSTYAVEAIAIAGGREGIYTDAVAASPARLPMGIRAGGFVFLSGRMASDYRAGLAPEVRTGEWSWLGSPIHKQTEYILGMHRDILATAGLSLADIVKAEVFIRRPSDVTGVDEVWCDCFGDDPPARSLFVVDGFAIPEALIEINVIALDPRSGLTRRTVVVGGVPEPLFHEPHAVQAGPLLFLSTGLAHDEGGLASSARPRPGFSHIGAPGRLEADLILERVDAICAAAGGSLADVAKVQSYLYDFGQLDAVNEVWKQAFPSDPPAWNAVGMSSSALLADSTVMCDVIAYIPEETR